MRLVRRKHYSDTPRFAGIYCVRFSSRNTAIGLLHGVYTLAEDPTRQTKLRLSTGLDRLRNPNRASVFVKTKQSAGTGRDVRFRTTQWELVLNARNADSSQQERCLSELCSRYWFPLYKFALFTGLSHEDAQDLTQSFFLYLLRKESLQHVDRAKGRLRSFLLASFRNHLSTSRQYASAAKRGGGKPSIDLDADDAAECHHLELADHLTAETFFDANWAQLLIERVTLRLGEEYRQRGKSHQFDRLQCHLEIGSEPDAKSYEEAGWVLGMSGSGAKTLVFRMRQRFAALMRQEVAQTLTNPRDTDAEIHALYSALRSTEGRLRDELGTR